MSFRSSDLAATLMGELLLKGYKMLATTCRVCNGVLMQDKEGNNTCVTCCQNQNQSRSNNGGDCLDSTHFLDLPNNDSSETLNPSNFNERQKNSFSDASKSCLDSTIECIMSELEVATKKIKSCSQGDFQYKEILIKYIRECAETLITVQKVRN